MRYSDRDKAFVVTKYNVETRQRTFHKVDEPLVLDFGNAKHGQERFQRGMKYDLIIAPLHEPLPDAPDDNYNPVGMMHVVVPSLGMTELIVDYDPLSDLLSNVYERYVASVEATKNQIPVVKFNATDMSMEIIDWIEREQRLFGKRLVPKPGLKHNCETDLRDIAAAGSKSCCASRSGAVAPERESMPRMSPLNGQAHASV